MTLDNVIVTPHVLGGTDARALVSGRGAVDAIIDVRAGRIPLNVVNCEVLDAPLLPEKLRHDER